jgi:hypothetical protein
MKIHIRFDESNEQHTRFTIFANGANCGQLCMRTDEAVHFHMIVAHGTSAQLDEFVSSGLVYDKNRSKP